LEEKEVVDGEGLPEFVEEARVPHFIESLGDVKKGCGTVLSIVKGCVDVEDETVGLVNSGVTSAEAELVGQV
jgi:hypothetical protein